MRFRKVDGTVGIFTNFVINGFNEQQEKLYSPGQLFEVMSKLGEELKPEDMRLKVKSLLSGWSAPAESFLEQNQKVPVYALEMHAINEQSATRNGYGTYIFVPDEMLKRVTNPVRSIFSEPTELYDDEDPLKILSAIYSDKNGFSTNQELSVYELSCKGEEFYPMHIWDKEFASDPLEEIFGVFDDLKPGDFAGVSIVVVPPDRDWDVAGKMRIRYIEDPEYEEDISIFEAARRVFHGEEMPDDEAERLAGYQKQQLDTAEKQEIKAILGKIQNDVFRCTIRVYASKPEVADELASIIAQRSTGRYNGLQIITKHGSLLDLAMRKEGTKPFLICSDEIAGMWHVPADNTQGEKLHKPLPAALTPPEELLAINIGEPGDIQKMLFTINTR